MKSKRAFLLAEETLKIILAVIALGFLAYLLFSIYQSSKDSRDLELAEESLNFLMSEINLGKTQVEIYNPRAWIILSWPFEDKRPASCENLGWENCVCIIKNVGNLGALVSTLPFTEGITDKFLENSNEGVCMESSFVVTHEDVQRPLLIDNPPIVLQINYEEQTITT